MRPVVLFIDDSRFVRTANERALTRAGYKVIGADDGQQAVELAKANRTAVVLLDLMLPKVTGVEVLRQLKSDQDTRAILVIVLSSLSERNKTTLLREGAAESSSLPVQHFCSTQRSWLLSPNVLLRIQLS